MFISIHIYINIYLFIYLYTCPDQFAKPLFYYLAMVAGIPRAIINAYRRYQENLKVYSSLALGLVIAHRRRNGIPQGCLLSMMFTALIMRLWMLLMSSLSVSPRTLADDLLVLAAGRMRLERIIEATVKPRKTSRDL